MPKHDPDDSLKPPMLSTAHLDTCPHPVALDLPRLAEDLEKRLPEAVFAFALGSSAKTGVVRARGDLDLAVYLVTGASITIDVQRRAEEAVGGQTDAGIRVDIGELNRADPVYRFEAISGRLLFCRDDEAYLDFFSRTSRDYETQMVHYARQRAYRTSGRLAWS